ncbi:hypothetical protein BRD00_04815 [Halobacteriales archaeon QS_8_69_26]|nr:MAG: hypothetical protein BRD00_04815 [Halobacteriales archaeon QS_8_69_26]
MRVETLLGAGVVAVVAGAMILTAFVPGVIASQDQDPATPPGDVAIQEVNIAAGPVTGGSATLSVDTRIRHRRGPAENVTVEFRAVNTRTGLVATTKRVDLGTVDVDGERRVRTDLVVPRKDGYRVEVVVFQNDSREDAGHKTVSGVGSLTPEYARTGLEFHRFEGIGVSDFPVIEYSIAETRDDRVTLSVTAFLTNTGDETATDLSLTLKARQSDSGIVADEQTVDLGEVRPGRTAEPTVDLTVPDNYNYYLDAVLRKDGVVVAAARSAAKLNPNGTITVEDPEDEGGLSVGDFERNRGESNDDFRKRSGEDAADLGGEGAPGFGPAVAVIGLLLAALLAAGRRIHD